MSSNEPGRRIRVGASALGSGRRWTGWANTAGGWAGAAGAWAAPLGAEPFIADWKNARCACLAASLREGAAAGLAAGRFVGRMGIVTGASETWLIRWLP